MVSIPSFSGVANLREAKRRGIRDRETIIILRHFLTKGRGRKMEQAWEVGLRVR